MAEELSFDILAKDRASDVISKVGKTSAETAAKIEAANLRVERATNNVARAEQKYGKGSLQAREASNKLALAQANVDKSMKTSAGAVEKTSNKLDKFKQSASLAGAAIGVALFKLGQGAVKNASDAEQSLGATQQIFGKTANKIIASSKEAATAVGLSASDYREASNLIGSLFKNQGVATDQLAGKTQSMVKLGADLSAVFGGPAKNAVDALGSAFKGEFDPLQQYGITLTQAAINTEVMRVANVKSSAEFGKLSTAQQTAAKQQATTNLITKQSASALGQFAAQSGTTAEQTQILKARYTNLSAELGAKLLPIVNKVLSSGLKLLAWMEKHPTATLAAAVAVGVLAAGMLALNIVMLANPAGLVVIGIALLAAAFVAAWKKSETFRGVMLAVFKVVAHTVLDNVSAIIGVFGALFGVLGHLPGKAGAAFRSAQHAAERAKAKVDGLGHSIDGLHGKNIKINVVTHYGHTGSDGKGGGNVPIGSATGGPVIGPGTGTSDSILRRLSNGEHVWTAAEVKNIGGHGVVEKLRKGLVPAQAVGVGVGAGSGGVSTVVLELKSSGSAVDDFLVKTIRNAVRVKGGGNVQVALGRNG